MAYLVCLVKYYAQPSDVFLSCSGSVEDPADIRVLAGFGWLVYITGPCLAKIVGTWSEILVANKVPV